MPSKGRRAAARQARIRQQRQRGRSAPQEFQAAPSVSRTAIQEEEGEVEARPQRSPGPTASGSSPSQPARRRRQVTKLDPTSTQHYLGGELRRIGAITLLVITILAVISFTMGS